jgi:hypothetical protein
MLLSEVSITSQGFRIVVEDNELQRTPNGIIARRMQSIASDFCFQFSEIKSSAKNRPAMRMPERAPERVRRLCMEEYCVKSQNLLTGKDPG